MPAKRGCDASNCISAKTILTFGNRTAAPATATSMGQVDAALRSTGVAGRRKEGTAGESAARHIGPLLLAIGNVNEGFPAGMMFEVIQLSCTGTV